MRFDPELIWERIAIPLLAGAGCALVMSCLIDMEPKVLEAAAALGSGILVATGTLILAFYTKRSVDASASSASAANKSIDNDIARSKRETTLDLFHRYEEVIIGARIKMSAAGAASKIMEWSPRHLSEMRAEKEKFLASEDREHDKNARTYAELYSAFPIASNFMKATLVLLEANTLEEELFMRLLARSMVRLYTAIEEGNRIVESLSDSDMDNLRELRDYCQDALPGP